MSLFPVGLLYQVFYIYQSVSGTGEQSKRFLPKKAPAALNLVWRYKIQNVKSESLLSLSSRPRRKSLGRLNASRLVNLNFGAKDPVTTGLNSISEMNDMTQYGALF